MDVASQQIRRPRLVSQLFKEKKLEEETEKKLSKLSNLDTDYNKVVPRVGFPLDEVPLEKYSGILFLFNITIVYEFSSKSSPLHATLYNLSEKACRLISHEVKQRLNFMQTHFEIEASHEIFWLKDWKSKLEKIRIDL